MAHKARRRPSWKKANRWKYSKYERYLHRELAMRLADEIRKEIDKEILAKLNEVRHNLPTIHEFGEEITYDRVDFKTRYDIDKKS